MKPPHGMRFANITTAEDLARNETRWHVTVGSVVHRSPLAGQGITPCCERSPFELPIWDRVTTDPAAVTCSDADG